MIGGSQRASKAETVFRSWRHHYKDVPNDERGSDQGWDISHCVVTLQNVPVHCNYRFQQGYTLDHKILSMAQGTTAVTPLLTHWSYCHQYAVHHKNYTHGVVVFCCGLAMLPISFSHFTDNDAFLPKRWHGITFNKDDQYFVSLLLSLFLLVFRHLRSGYGVDEVRCESV